MRAIAIQAAADLWNREVRCGIAFSKAKTDDLGSKAKHQAYWEMERTRAAYRRIKIQERYLIALHEVLK